LENIYLKLHVNCRIQFSEDKTITGSLWQGEVWWRMNRKLVAAGYKSSVIMVVELVAGYRSLSK